MRILLRPTPQTPTSALRLEPAAIHVATRPMRVLDFDLECRPMHFYGEYVSKEITAIAWAWTHRPDDVTCLLLGEWTLPDMLKAFVVAYDHADMVTGHYIRGFDLPLMNGALTEFQLPTLADKLSHDTKLDLTRRHGLSGSQENIGGMLGLDHPKVPMDQTKWRSANRLTPEGLEEVRRRVIGDVQQHIEMRARLLQLGYLGPPQMWRTGSTKAEAYTP